MRRKLFGGRPAVGETVTISGVRFIVIGVLELKLQISNYFAPTTRAPGSPTPPPRAVDTKYASTLVFTGIAPRFEKAAIDQVRAALAKRQRFSPTDKRAIQASAARSSAHHRRHHIGLQVLLIFIVRSPSASAASAS